MVYSIADVVSEMTELENLRKFSKDNPGDEVLADAYSWSLFHNLWVLIDLGGANDEAVIEEITSKTQLVEYCMILIQCHDGMLHLLNYIDEGLMECDEIVQTIVGDVIWEIMLKVNEKYDIGIKFFDDVVVH